MVDRGIYYNWLANVPPQPTLEQAFEGGYAAGMKGGVKVGVKVARAAGVMLTDAELNILINSMNTLLEQQRRLAGALGSVMPHQAEAGMDMVEVLMKRYIGIREQRRVG